MLEWQLLRRNSNVIPTYRADFEKIYVTITNIWNFFDQKKKQELFKRFHVLHNNDMKNDF